MKNPTCFIQLRLPPPPDKSWVMHGHRDGRTLCYMHTTYNKKQSLLVHVLSFPHDMYDAATDASFVEVTFDLHGPNEWNEMGTWTWAWLWRQWILVLCALPPYPAMMLTDQNNRLDISRQSQLPCIPPLMATAGNSQTLSTSSHNMTCLNLLKSSKHSPC